MTYLILKSLHIVFIVSWFAGLFYLVRLFVYAIEAQKLPEPEKSILTKQYIFMQRKLLFVITWPAAVLTIVFGLSMLVITPEYLLQSWMIVKLIFVTLLVGYHLYCHKIFKEQSNFIFKHSSLFFRAFNEIATVLLLAIVLLAVIKTSTDFTRYFVAVVAFIILIGLFIYAYNKKQKDSNQEQ